MSTAAINLSRRLPDCQRRQKAAESAAWNSQSRGVVHPAGEQPPVDMWSATADTFAGRVHVEWDATAPIRPFGQLPFFID
ncbi:MAG TPA: hypothetical protein VME47_11545, partial [Acetobacteraceae bacterium]|nr:hypothetical protein [Acetobacteraceae bacterium]